MSQTERLYYNHPRLQSFDAEVTRVEPRGDATAVWLDRTAFYPTSGGQPHDLGTLAGSRVIDVQDDEQGDVVHIVEGAVPAPGAVVHGDVNWDRRFDHMQQHTGQHLLSAVLEQLFQAATTGFHLGSESSTIDLDRELSLSQLAHGELEVNRAIWRDIPVSVRYVGEDEARLLPLRKESARTGTLRLVDIDGIDLSACGGTHVERTGSIGQLSIASWERGKGGQRLEFLCGGRALTRAQRLRDTSAASVRLLSVLPENLPAAIERLQGDLKEQKRTLTTLQGELAAYEAVSLADGAEPVVFGRLVLRVMDGDSVRLKTLASAVVARPGLLAVLISASTPALGVAARSGDIAVPCNELIASLAKQFGGRGGGKPDLAQCGALQASSDDVLAAVRGFLAHLA